MNQDKIIIRGAKENNLKNINLEIPRNKLVIMTGVSGSGKTSLAFDTIYAEGQRRYVESLSAYARQFLGNMEKPNVESIEGLSPAISIDQKTTSNNPRSTVGTVTEIYDYLRLLYARIGIPYCPIHNEPIQGQTIKQIVDKVMELEDQSKIMILAPVIQGKKGTHFDLLNNLRKEGFIRVKIDKEIRMLEDEIELEKNKKHDIDVVVDRIIKNEQSRSRISDSLETALKLADGFVKIEQIGQDEMLFSTHYACKKCGFSIPKLEPRLFSFNSPLGACEDCKGLGFKQEVDVDLLIPNKELSINQGGIIYYKNILNSENIEWQQFDILLREYGIDKNKPLKDLTDEEINIILYGSTYPISYTITSRNGNSYSRMDYIEGVKSLIERRFIETTSPQMREWYQNYMCEHTCNSCQGLRLNKYALAVKVGSKNIQEFCQMSVSKAIVYLEELTLTKTQQEIANLILKEIKERLNFLRDVGLNYLTLDRMAKTLSGGEAQRIRLATQIGSRLSGVLYVLDEPSIGLHQRDNDRLITTLKSMRDLGNTLIVVEHDEDTMLASDWIVDIGPGAGSHGGEVIFSGPTAEILKDERSLTGQYLSHRKKIMVPSTRRKGNGKYLKIINARENNLKNISVEIPLNTLTVVTGVSGGGKSSLINEVLAKSLQQVIYKSKVKPGLCDKIEGIENIDKVIEVGQEPIGKTPRSNPVTYTGVFDDIRDLFAKTSEARMRGYEKGRFSFNVKGGRCEACQGDGVKRISMHFLPDVYVVCEECNGKRYNEETLQVTYHGKNIYEVLELTVEEAIQFFYNVPKIRNKLQILEDVGLGYIKLGQSATTLSGGEAQRVKLASELQKKATGKTIFILDEPTTGLHVADVEKLLTVLQRIVDNGDSVIVIEHNLDVIKSADYIIDLGPEGGDEGGRVVVCGTPEKVSKCSKSYTGKYLKRLLEDK